MSNTLKVIYKDQADNEYALNIYDPKDGVTKADVKQLADYLLTNHMIEGKKAPLASFNTAYIIKTTKVELA